MFHQLLCLFLFIFAICNLQYTHAPKLQTGVLIKSALLVPLPSRRQTQDQIEIQRTVHLNITLVLFQWFCRLASNKIPSAGHLSLQEESFPVAPGIHPASRLIRLLLHHCCLDLSWGQRRLRLLSPEAVRTVKTDANLLFLHLLLSSCHLLLSRSSFLSWSRLHITGFVFIHLNKYHKNEISLILWCCIISQGLRRISASPSVWVKQSGGFVCPGHRHSQWVWSHSCLDRGSRETLRFAQVQMLQSDQHHPDRGSY